MYSTIQKSLLSEPAYQPPVIMKHSYPQPRSSRPSLPGAMPFASLAFGFLLAHVSAAAPIFFIGNGSYYDVITARVPWTAADAAAKRLPTFLGRTGRLATITSKAENDFLRDSFTGRGW